MPEFPHLDAQLIATFAAADQHAAAARIAQRVLNQVENDLLQQDEVTAHPSVARQRPEREFFLPRSAGKSSLGMRQQLRDREHRDVDSGRAGIELGDIKQRAEQLVHRGERFFDAADNLTALAGAQLAMQLRDEEAQERGAADASRGWLQQQSATWLDWRLRAGGCVLRLCLPSRRRILQPGGHGVELIAQRLEFVAGVD